MPFYDYRCSEGHVTEARKEMCCAAIACPSCGGVAERAPFYADQIIRGETVARNSIGNSIKSKHGYFRFDHADEAIREIAHESDKVGKEPPDLYSYTKKKLRSEGLLTTN